MSKQLNVTVIAFDDCMTSAVFGLIDAFDLAERSSVHQGRLLPITCKVATPTGLAVRGSSGRAIEPDYGLEQAGDSDVVIVPAVLGDVIGALEREHGFVGWLSRLDRQKTLLASACTGAFFLAEAGALDGRRVTTNPFYSELFKRRYPRVGLEQDLRITDVGDIVCAGSTTAVLDLAIYLLERLAGHELAVRTAKMLSMPVRSESQRPYFLFVAPRDHGDDRILQVQDWLDENFTRDIRLRQLADAGALSTRSVNRRFRNATGLTPLEYQRALRMEAAKRLLEDASQPIDHVAYQVGFQDTRAFARAFRALAGLSPSQYRQKFQAISYCELR